MEDGPNEAFFGFLVARAFPVRMWRQPMVWLANAEWWHPLGCQVSKTKPPLNQPPGSPTYPSNDHQRRTSTELRSPHPCGHQRGGQGPPPYA
ncbi:hypothetical protein CDAR_74831 [Caerostris darwini]|uniref:Uncharacterized protein n=1 Tax=Caerostris darwini TaxID=1538125 RepID=A0AAV4P028_9ARAC|nr:hypothetical protein CDAR_74831 [Caerostris darwini]